MQDRTSNTENRRGGEPQRIGDILAELLARHQTRFPTAGVTVVETPAVMEGQSCSFYPAEMASLS
ncbi:MAG: hypothetical protein ABSG86_10575 [Thermoguttaceae bacterium]|jgi:hypothetical protein